MIEPDQAAIDAACAASPELKAIEERIAAYNKSEDDRIAVVRQRVKSEWAIYDALRAEYNAILSQMRLQMRHIKDLERTTKKNKAPIRSIAQQAERVRSRIHAAELKKLRRANLESNCPGVIFPNHNAHTRDQT